jgi:UDP-N-acetylglucosamine 4-epimerase
MPVGESYSDVLARACGFRTIKLSYFDISGRRQVKMAPALRSSKWIAAMIKNDNIFITGDGEISRDLSYTDKAMQARLLAATASNEEVANEVYYVAIGDRSSLNQLYFTLRDNLAKKFSHLQDTKPVYRYFLIDDVRHSFADT